MSSQNEKVKEIFNSAIEVDLDHRQKFLEEACNGNASILEEVMSLVEHHEKANEFLEVPAVNLVAEALSDSSNNSKAEINIKGYKVIREIAHGGMGAVYLAVRDNSHYQKRVAIKVIKPGLDTEDILRRFRNEQKILASLDHPNIAKLFDGDITDSGLPYFIMEYIEGKPLNKYCDANKLPIVERLKLFCQVCSAVQYAHQNLIVHRDIKPSNILVTNNGTPKLLDFGIAKFLNPELSAQTIDPTSTDVWLLTPEYASPEQVSGEVITTATDIYSLGVLLYELLTGHKPYQFKNRLPQEIIDVICNKEPEKPSVTVNQIREIRTSDGGVKSATTPESVAVARGTSTDKLQRFLVGDIDNIVLMAMHKDVKDRYVSVEQFLEDIHRYLNGQPVVAQKGSSLNYRTTKFVKRNKAVVLALAVALMILTLGVTVIAWQAHVAEIQRAKAERRFNQVRELVNSLLFKVNDEIEKVPGTTKARTLLVSGALQYLDNLNGEVDDDSPLKRELATAYEKVGFIQWNRDYANLGNTKAALSSQYKALIIRQALVSKEPQNLQLQLELVKSYRLYGDLLAVTSSVSAALENYRKDLAIIESLDQSKDLVRRELAITYNRIGDTLGSLRQPNIGDTFGALKYFELGKGIRDYQLKETRNNFEIRNNLSASYFRIGGISELNGDLGAAKYNYTKSLEIRESLLDEKPNDAEVKRALASSKAAIGNILRLSGDLAGAEKYYVDALDIHKTLVVMDTANRSIDLFLARSAEGYGQLLVDLGDFKGAIKQYGNALEIRNRALEIDPDNLRVQCELSENHFQLAEAFSNVSDISVAVEHYREAMHIGERLSKIDPANVKFDLCFAKALYGLAKFSDLEATQLTLRAIAIIKKRTEQFEPNSLLLDEYAKLLLSCKPTNLRNPALALDYAKRSVERSGKENPNLLATLALAHYSTGNRTEAIDIQQKAVDLSTKGSPLNRHLQSDLVKFRVIPVQQPH